MARPPKPTEDHLRDGTLRPARHADRAPVRLVEVRDTATDPVVRAFVELAADLPPWLQASDAVALRLLAERLTMRADLRVQAEAGDATARRDLLALDRVIDSSLDALGLTTESRAKLSLSSTPATSKLDDMRAKHAKRTKRT